MTATGTNTAKKTAALEQAKKKRIRAYFALFLIVLVIVAAGFSIFCAGRILFSANPRFKLRELRIDGAGYWKEHQDELIRQIKLKMGTNLFLLDMNQLREEVKKIANVDDCSVIRVLPDTLIFQITERVPRAFLGNDRSPWVVDGKGIIMHRKQSMASYSKLPVITNVSFRNAKVGKELQSVRPAVDLIMMTVHSFPDFRIYEVSMKNPGKMKILLQYRKFPIYQVLLPIKNRGLSLSFHVLQSAIIDAKKNNETRTHYDLSYDNNVVIN